MSLKKETWKPIDGYKYYAVSNQGRVRSLDHFDSRGHLRDGKILSQSMTNHGYSVVTLTEEGKKKRNMSVHRLVANAFIPNPDNKPQVNHKNGNKQDNRVENLEWSTSSENNKHAFRVLGRKPTRISRPNPGRKFSPEQIRSIRSDTRRQIDIAVDYGIDQTTVSDIKRKKIYRDIA